MDTTTKEALREIGRRISALYGEASPGQGMAVGSTGERAAQEAEALSAFCRGIRAGKSPLDAATEAKAAIRTIIATHNNRRAGDVNWQVWEGSYDFAIDAAAARFETPVAKQEAA